MSTCDAPSFSFSVAPRVSGVTPVEAWDCSASASVLALILRVVFVQDDCKVRKIR